MSDTTQDGTKPTDTTTDATSATEPLGDGGKKALDAERAARREAERRLKDAEAKVAAMELAEARREVASAKGLTAQQARFLTGDTREALETAADDLLAAFTPQKQDTTTTGKSRPKEALQGGASNPEEDTGDLGQVADKILR